MNASIFSKKPWFLKEIALLAWVGASFGLFPNAPIYGQGKKEAQDPKQLKFFEAEVRPILVEKCYACHSLEAGLSEGNLRVDSRQAIRKGGSSGAAVVPGDLKGSLLIRAIRYEDKDFAMPPEDSGGKLSGKEIEILERWVKQGAADPREEDSSLLNKDPYQDSKAWWAYQPVRKPGVPSPKDSSWAYGDIDRFIHATHEAKGLTPVADASAEVMLRRVYFDLVGLPPSRAEVGTFYKIIDEKKSIPAAMEVVVDKLLASEQFGMHFGRHWLDVARYAESTGRDVNVAYPHAWRYRDYVIDAFNKNMPYDQFLKEQIAGDLLESKSSDDRSRQMIATGFLAIGSKSVNERNPKQFAVDMADEQIDATFQATMGLTVACARCHDHKFDPIPQKDYTAIAGIFLSTETKFGTTGGPQARNFAKIAELPHEAPMAMQSITPEQLARKKKTLQESKSELEEAIAERRKAGRNGDNTPNPKILRMVAQVSALEGEIASYESNGQPKPLAMAVTDKPKNSAAPSRQMGRNRMQPGQGPRFRGGSTGFEAISDAPLFVRGDIDMAGSSVPRGLLTMFDSSSKVRIPSSASGRKELAQWIVSKENPMTARVAVNRIWYWLMGQGIVTSLDNFGSTGALPSHPELLDYLANRFIESGWNTKALIREIVLSHTYQISSQHHEANLTADPDNQFLWRANRERLTAESIRDSILAASGALDRKPQIGSAIAREGDGQIGGPRLRGMSEGEITQADSRARSVYLPAPRSLGVEILETFDMPDASAVQTAREATNVPSQSLFLLNSRFVDYYSREMAKRILETYPGRSTLDDYKNRIEFAYELTLSRKPTDEERKLAESLLEKLNNNPLIAWTSLSRSLIATAEFRYVD